jgi:hypothetical protein
LPYENLSSIFCLLSFLCTVKMQKFVFQKKYYFFVCMMPKLFFQLQKPINQCFISFLMLCPKQICKNIIYSF